MNVTRATVEPNVAERKLRAVRRALRRRATDPELLALEAAYVEATKRRPIIELSEAIAAAPRDQAGRPRLAIARADRRRVRVRLIPGEVIFSALGSDNGGSTRGGTPNVTTLVTRCAWPHRLINGMVDGFALVPMVPPDVLETVPERGQMARYHILFEVERWSESPIGARPDRDPYLLRHVTGDLWAVMAEWDLTDIERAVMASRARSDG